MSDPRNVAHDKKVKQEKAHQHSEAKKPASQPTEAAAASPEEPSPAAADHQKAVALLSKLKEIEFHARANVETLAGLMLTIDDELKQKQFSQPISEIYSAQEQLHGKLAEFVADYEEQLTAAITPA